MIVKTASAGTLESSDCLVTVSPSRETLIESSGPGGKLFAARNARVAREALARLGVTAARIAIQDQGALEITLRARIETALERASDAREEGTS